MLSHLRSCCDAKLFGGGDLLNSGVVNGVIIEHGISDAHVNTFVWVEVHVSSGIEY